MLALAAALSTWAPAIRGRSVRLFGDNTVAEWAFRRGSAAALDHAALVHHFWAFAAALRVRVQIDRVPTGERCRGPFVLALPGRSARSDDNLADLPSREDYALLQRIGARRVPLQLEERFHSLQLPCQLAAL